jgi:hypothetical protein
MGHAAHFLERLDRIPRSQVDFALVLYRDSELVKWILRYAKIEANDERIALALEDGGEGPHVIVTRNAHFVTTLGKGMSTGPHRVVSRAQIDVYVDKVEEARRRREISAELVPSGKSSHDILGLPGKRADGLSREEVTAILGWQPLLHTQLLIEAFRTAQALEEVERSLVPQLSNPVAKTAQTIDEAHRFSYTLGVLFTLAVAGEMPWISTLTKDYGSGGGVTFSATSRRLMATGLRGAWLAARVGKALLPSYKNALLAQETSSIGRFDAILGVTAIGLRHARAHGDATRVLEAAQAVGSIDPWLPEFVPRALAVLGDPDAAIERALVYGRQRYAYLARSLPAGSPHRITSVGDVPRDLALVAMVNSEHDSVGPASIDALAWVACVRSPEEFHFPEPLARAFLPLARRHELAVARMERVRGDWLADGGVPAKRATVQGRNEPCACGSGKKFKKCCGQGAR